MAIPTRFMRQASYIVAVFATAATMGMCMLAPWAIELDQLEWPTKLVIAVPVIGALLMLMSLIFQMRNIERVLNAISY